MSGHLDIDLDEVALVSTNLQRISHALGTAQADADTLAAAIPVPSLATASTDFAGKWDDRRRELIEQITALKEQAQAVVDAFTDVDSQLADALTRPPQPASSGGHQAEAV